MPSTAVSDRPTVHQLKIELRGLRPPVWRRVRVPSRLSLGGLHEVVQVLFGWDGIHLHVFEDGRRAAWGPHRDPLGGAFDSGWDDEDDVSLADVLPRAGGRLSYRYDLGDDWEHRITVDEVRPADPDEAGHVVCTGGRRTLPDCDDVGGVWALQELLERYEAGERPEPVTEEDGEPEYDSHTDYVLAHMLATGFDPACLDVAELNRALEELPLLTVDGVSAAEEQGGRFLCPSCGEWHPLPDGDGGDFADLVGEVLDPASRTAPAIRLPDDAELARQVRGAEHFMAAVRLGHWCGAGRELTPKGVLRPKLARQAVEEAGLWRAAPDEWGDAAERRQRLADIRSAADMGPVQEPWGWALLAGFVEVSGDGKKASSGAALPDELDDAAVLTAWQETLAGAVADVFAELPEPIGMLRLMSGLGELLAQAPPVGFGLLLHCYGLPEGEWADVAAFFGESLEDLPDDAAGELLSALYVVQWEEAAELLVRFGAAEYRPEDPPPGDEQDDDWLLIGLSAPVPGRIRLTSLGRAGLRGLLVEAGVSAPVVGRMERAEAAELLAALATYRYPEDVRAEVVGWLAPAHPLARRCSSSTPAAARRGPTRCGGSWPHSSWSTCCPPSAPGSPRTPRTRSRTSGTGCARCCARPPPPGFRGARTPPPPGCDGLANPPRGRTPSAGSGCVWTACTRTRTAAPRRCAPVWSRGPRAGRGYASRWPNWPTTCGGLGTRTAKPC
ncbi:hypothetical protein N8I87_40655 [Streptomyces sp. HUAS TT20]|nr:hypothetical protein N8I87_40655 [Streptomyces sp. HUAS 15-9]